MTNMKNKPQEKWECLRCQHPGEMFLAGASARNSEDGSLLPSDITGRPKCPWVGAGRDRETRCVSGAV